MLTLLLLFVFFGVGSAATASTNWRNPFAFATINKDGTVSAFGLESAGGKAPVGLAHVRMIFSTNRAFTALLHDTTLRCWGKYSVYCKC